MGGPGCIQPVPGRFHPQFGLLDQKAAGAGLGLPPRLRLRWHRTQGGIAGQGVQMGAGQPGELGEAGLTADQGVARRRQLGAVQVEPCLGLLLVGDGGVAGRIALAGGLELFLDGGALRLGHGHGILRLQHRKITGGHLGGQLLQRLRQLAEGQPFAHLGLAQAGAFLGKIQRNAQHQARQLVVVAARGLHVGVQPAFGGRSHGSHRGTQYAARCPAQLAGRVDLLPGRLQRWIVALCSLEGLLQPGGMGRRQGGGQQAERQGQAQGPSFPGMRGRRGCAYHGSVPCHARFLLGRPRVDAADQVVHLFETVVPEKTHGLQAAHAMMADADHRLAGVCPVDEGRQLGQRHIVRVRQADVLVFPFFTHVQQQGWLALRIGQPCGQLGGRESVHRVRNGSG